MDENIKNLATIDDFKRIEIRAGKILTAETVAGSEKLLKLSVDLGEQEPRQVISGIAKYILPENLVGTKCAFVTNLEPREIMSLESKAMIMAISGENYFSLLRVSDDAPPGSLVK
jgi:methionyl-tRNA synthetase